MLFRSYLFISSAFEKAVADIINGADVKRALDTAADAIDKDIADNGNYAAK